MYKNSATAFLTIVFVCLSLSVSYADIINVPDDFDSIQDAIDESERGDTVLVQPGVYEENLDYGRRDITVGSLYLTTDNEAYIDSTIIDGTENGTVIHFHGGEGPDARLTGFTIENGTGYDGGGSTFGGAIHCWRNSSPTLDHLVVRRSEADNGGGIYCQDTNQMEISHVEVYECEAANGAGVRILRGSAVLDHVSIHDNSATNVGGGMQIVWAAEATLINVTLTRNTCQRGGAIYISATNEQNTASNAILVNTILWDNSSTIYFSGSYDLCTMEIDYSDIEDGENGVELNNNGWVEWGNNNIDEDPEFVNPNQGDFHLTVDSPCINTGDPDSPEDPDGSRADMGAYPYFSQDAMLHGFVLDLENDDPLEGATIITSNNQVAESDEDGYWIIDNPWTGNFTATASLFGYTDLTIRDLDLDMDDTLLVTFRLPRPEFDVSCENMIIDVPLETVEEVPFTVINEGTGPTEWCAEKRILGEQFIDPWELRTSIAVGDTVDDTEIWGVAFANDQYFVSGTNDDEPLIYVLDRDGNLETSFEQGGIMRQGMRDLAWDGNLLWGSGERTIYGFTTEGEVRTSFDGPFYPNNAIAYDNENNYLWISSTVSEYIAAYNLNGEEMTWVDRHNLNVFGLAFWADDPDGCQLYVLNSPGQGRQVVHKINIELDTLAMVVELEPEPGGRPEGSFISTDYDPLSVVMMTISNNPEEDGGDRIDVWQVCVNASWLELEPVEGLIEAGSSQEATVILNAGILPMDRYIGEIEFSHNCLGANIIIPIEMRVVHPDRAENPDKYIPGNYFLTDVYPNPFNSIAKLSYGLPESGPVSVRIFDGAGRLVETVYDGFSVAGSHDFTWNASDIPAGIYMVCMEANGFHEVRKALLVK